MSKRSQIWLYFTPKANKKKAQCNLCTSERIFTTPHSATSTLWQHLRSEHHVIWEKLQSTNEINASSSKSTSQKQVTLFQSLKESTKVALDRCILRFIVDNHLSFNLVSRDTFKDLFSLLGYSPPNRKQLATMVDKAAVEVRIILQKQLCEWTKSIALTSDGWTDDVGHKFIAITSHFLDSSFHLHSRCLDLFELDESHTGEAIQKSVQKAVEYFTIQEDSKISVVSLTTDNGANMLKAVKLSCWPGIECFAHTLQLCIKNPLDSDEMGIFRQMLYKVLIAFFFCISYLLDSKIGYSYS